MRKGDRLKRARRATFSGLHGLSELEHDHEIDEDLIPHFGKTPESTTRVLDGEMDANGVVHHHATQEEKDAHDGLHGERKRTQSFDFPERLIEAGTQRNMLHELRIYFDALYRIDLVHARVRTIIEVHNLKVEDMFGLVDEDGSGEVHVLCFALLCFALLD